MLELMLNTNAAEPLVKNFNHPIIKRKYYKLISLGASAVLKKI